MSNHSVLSTQEVDMLERFLSMIALAVFLVALMRIPHYGHSIAVATAFTLGRICGLDPFSLHRMMTREKGNSNI